MSRELSSLRIDCDPVDQPAATDAVERASWSALRIAVSSRVVTRVIDRALNTERTSLYVPALPVVAWIVNNWWALLEEPARVDEPATSPLTDAHFAWTQRHCLRCADSGTLLPALYLFSDGVNLRACWQDDPDDSVPHMTGAFVDSGHAILEKQASKAALEQFVQETLSRVRTVDDEHVASVCARWTAIRTSTDDETDFCRLVGRMGLDPYDASLPKPLVSLLEQEISDPDDALIQDLTEIADAVDVAAQWHWIQSTLPGLGRRLERVPQIERFSWNTAWEAGYAIAQFIRGAINGSVESPIGSVADIARSSIEADLISIDRNHIPGQGISGVVGWRSRNEIAVIGPRSAHESNRRFFEARALYHAIYGCASGARLVTRAHTWDQQASRAFAAELLAPQKVLVERTGAWADQNDIDSLAKEFNVSAFVIQRQLNNSGVSFAD